MIHWPSFTLLLMTTICSSFDGTSSPGNSKKALYERDYHNEVGKLLLPKTASYPEMLEFNNVFIDNSLLIKELFDCDKKLIVITAPRGFGKSLNLDMIRTFVEIETDSKGIKVPFEQQRNRIFFQTGVYTSPEDEYEQHNFQAPLLISHHKEFFDEHQGQHPVVHLKFEEFIYHVDYESMCLFINKAIAAEYRKHVYLFEYLKQEEYEKLEPKRRDEVLAKQLQFEDVVDVLEIKEPNAVLSLKRLCKLLYEYYGKRVVILIDDYEHVLAKAFEYKFSCKMKYYKPIIERKSLLFYRKWFNATFNDNPYLEKAILTGKLLFSKEMVFSYLPEELYAAYDSFNNIYEDYYGFTAEEVRNIYERSPTQWIPTVTFNNALDWYKGYRFNRNSNLVLFNPYAIAKFLEAEKIGNFWENECMMYECRTMRKFFEIRSLEKFFERFYKGETVQVNYTNVEIHHDEYYTALFFANSSKLPVPEGGANATIVLKLLSAYGYVTMVDNYTSNENSIVKMANKETASVCARGLDHVFGTYPWLNEKRYFIGYPFRPEIEGW